MPAKPTTRAGRQDARFSSALSGLSPSPAAQRLPAAPQPPPVQTDQGNPPTSAPASVPPEAGQALETARVTPVVPASPPVTGGPARTPEAPADSQATRSSASQATRGPRPRRYRGARARGPKGPAWVQVHVYLPPRIMAELNYRADGIEASKPRVLFDALVAVREQLPALIAARHAAAQPEKTGPFLYPQTRQAGPQKDDTSIRMRAANREAVDDIAWEVYADDRTELIEVALEAYFEATGWHVHHPTPVLNGAVP